MINSSKNNGANIDPSQENENDLREVDLEIQELGDDEPALSTGIEFEDEEISSVITHTRGRFRGWLKKMSPYVASALVHAALGGVITNSVTPPEAMRQQAESSASVEPESEPKIETWEGPTSHTHQVDQATTDSDIDDLLAKTGKTASVDSETQDWSGIDGGSLDELGYNKMLNSEIAQDMRGFFDQEIDKYFDSSSPEYTGEIPPASSYFQVDAMKHVMQRAERTVSRKLTDEEIQGDITKITDELQELYGTKLQKLIENPDYKWTGDIYQDFEQLQQALFIGEDRFFSNPEHSNTKYQKNYAGFGMQLKSGIVNCQVARMTPLILAEVYSAKGIDTSVLDNYRAIVWSDHVFSGYADPEKGIQILREGAIGQPVTPGLTPPGAQNPGVAMPVGEHLANYFYETRVATPEQIDRMVSLGVLSDTAKPYSTETITEEVIDFAVAAEMLENVKTAAEKREEYLSGVAEKLGEEKYGGYEKRTAEDLLEEGIVEGINKMLYQIEQTNPYGLLKGRPTAINTPDWITNKNAVEFIEKHAASGRMYLMTRYYIYRTLYLFGLDKEYDLVVDREVEAVQKVNDFEKWGGGLHRASPISKSVAIKLAEDPAFRERWEERYEGLKEIINRVGEDRGLEGGIIFMGQYILEYLYFSEVMAESSGDLSYLEHNEEMEMLLDKVKDQRITFYTQSEIREMDDEKFEKIATFYAENTDIAVRATRGLATRARMSTFFC